MTGEDLYTIYADEMLYRDVQVDVWDDLDEADRESWNALAERVQWV